MGLQETETLIIGAGMSGLALSCLLAKDKKPFITLEAHSLPGGCASFFQKDGHMFDVGATTLSGFRNKGPLQQFIDYCDFPRGELNPVDDGITVGLGNNQRLTHGINLEKWIDDQANAFSLIPKYELENLWHKIHRYNDLAWSLMDQLNYFPPRSLSDIFHLLTTKVWSKLQVAPLLLHSFSRYFAKDLKKILAKDPKYYQLLSELMLIATQNTPDKTPALFGVMGLGYANDMWYHQGGVGGFSRAVFSHTIKMGGKIRLNEKVEKIEQINNENNELCYLLHTCKRSYLANKVVSTLPIWNTLELTKDFLPSSYKKKIHKLTPKWGAVTGYYVIDFKKGRRPGEDRSTNKLYHQVHLDRPIQYCSSKSVFLSLSSIGDCVRGIKDNNQATLTVSTHIDIDQFFKLLPNDTSIAVLKTEWDRQIQRIIHNYFMGDVESIKCYGIGDPITFKKYTQRFQGSVGGIPHEFMSVFGKTPSAFTGLKSFYQLGDTSFPGQGIVAVVAGAMSFHHKIYKLVP